ncbi:isochorismatase family protein [bacterium]|nr:isochorismatase family protein [bacterium]
MPNLPRSHELLSRNDSRLLVIDLQEKLVPLIDGHERVIASTVKLITAAGVLGVPVSATEQYPQGLGPTVEPLRGLLPACPAKIEFSCLNSLGWNTEGSDPEGRFKVVVAGIEAHVCVQQTVLDLLAHGFRVYVAADAVSSRSAIDREVALQRMSQCGAVITTAESVLFEWCERAGSDEFKAISKLVKG